MPALRKPGLIALAIFSSMPSLYGLGKPRVLIIDWVNKENDPQFDYLARSIPEAMAEELKKRFVFELMQERDWRESQKENLIQNEDLATPSVALQLGNWNTQSVVISGSFRPIKGAARKTLLIEAALYSIPDEKRVLQYSEEVPVSSDMFSPLSVVAGKFAEKAKDLLPSEESFKIAEVKELERMQNYLVFRPEALVFARPAQQQNLLVSSTVSPADLPIEWGGSFEYRRFGFWKPFLGAYANAGGHYGVATLSGRGTSVPASVFDIRGAAGVSWYFGFLRRFYILPQLGGGFQYGQVFLTGQASPIYNQAFTASVAFAEARINFGMYVTRRVAIEIAPAASLLFYQGLNVFQAGLAVAGVWKF